jgi:aspartate aminotransferase
VEALESPTSEQAVARMVEEFKRRRDALVGGLNSIPGVRCLLPKASFYAFPNIVGTVLSSRDMAARLLQEAGVAALAGEAFGEGGAGFIRLAYTQGLSDIEEAVRRVAAFVDAAATARVG